FTWCHVDYWFGRSDNRYHSRRLDVFHMALGTQLVCHCRMCRMYTAYSPNQDLRCGERIWGIPFDPMGANFYLWHVVCFHKRLFVTSRSYIVVVDTRHYP